MRLIFYIFLCIVVGGGIGYLFKKSPKTMLLTCLTITLILFVIANIKEMLTFLETREITSNVLQGVFLYNLVPFTAFFLVPALIASTLVSMVFGRATFRSKSHGS